MSYIPRKRGEQVVFFENHIEAWTTNVAALGLTPALVNALDTKTLTARAALKEAEIKRQEARAALQNFHNACDAMRSDGAEAIRLIKNKFLATQDPNIWVLAQLPPPAQPGPMPPPGMPFDFRATLETDGSISFRWKANNPQGSSGIVWTVRRKLAGEANYSIAGATGLRKFNDATLPAGTPSVQYIVSGQRGQSIGPNSSPFVVQFGVGGGGLTIAAQFTDESGEGFTASGEGAKLAA
jgi:hypothetical protein